MGTAKWLKGECPLTVGGGQKRFLSLGRAKRSTLERFCQLVPSALQAALGPTGQARPLAARLAQCSSSWDLVSVLLLYWMCFCYTASTLCGPSRICDLEITSCLCVVSTASSLVTVGLGFASEVKATLAIFSPVVAWGTAR